ncbi:hypothetical protein HYPSUDRAFT_92319 [Hypholoma sublateritium FD-334 SS-4]|uniref:F-box domain-containing protein n=1 Tax=Hypholoma sublateritium (strain FD-334 SS-4) TaxID=945553 RepID=A0A0D2KIM8_HYPSF|nr:hypothetical protein HYPSUDRAFT_92319 [Hypholoma sublateritium FD-334 SS-4]
MNPKSLLENLHPELILLTASYLPLHHKPATLLSLALTNRKLHDIVSQCLYGSVVLRNDTAQILFQKIQIDNSLGAKIREIYINFGPGAMPSTVEPFIQLVIAGFLPLIHSLWIRKEIGYRMDNLPFFPVGFFKILLIKCPRLRALSVSGFVDYGVGELRASGLYDLALFRGFQGIGLANIAQNMPVGAANTDLEYMVRNIPHLTTSIRDLHIDLRKSDVSFPVSAIFSLIFSRLTSLVIGGISTRLSDDYNSIQSEAMDFWRCHPYLERLELIDTMNKEILFCRNNIDVEFLPNLKHLKCCFSNALPLANILHHLSTLCIIHSTNSHIRELRSSREGSK